MKILVIGGTGTVGSLVVQGLVAKGFSPLVLSRSPAKAAKLPEGAILVAGDLLDPYAARDAFKDVDRVFMVNAASTSEAFEGVTAVLLAKDAGVKRFVYSSTHRADLTPFLPIGGATKLSVENAIVVSDIPYTVLRPNNFFQNDLWYEASILGDGIYPQPIGFKGMSRVDARDIAKAAVSVLLGDGHEGKTYNITGPAVQTGLSCAAVWAAALNRPVKYAGNDMELYARMHNFLGPALVFTYSRLLEFYQENGLLAAEADIFDTTKLLGRGPRSLEAFAEETARKWLAAK
ncbi:MAG: NmrA family NAD(P)-binding protein [Methylocella sp.]